MKTTQEGLFLEDYYRHPPGEADPIKCMTAVYRLALTANTYQPPGSLQAIEKEAQS